MAFTPDEIEDGTGKAGAVVYSTTGDPIAQAEALLARLGKTTFAALTGNIGSVPAKEVHLVRGTRFVEHLGRYRIQGAPSHEAQALLQPRRRQFVDGLELLWEEVPVRWIRACAIAADLSAQGLPLHAVVESQRNVKREVVGPIETEWTGAGKTEAKKYTEVEDEIEPMLEPAFQMERG